MMKKLIGTTLLSASLLLSTTQFATAEDTTEETVPVESTETASMPTADYEQTAYNAIKKGTSFTHHGITVTDKDMLSRYIKYHLLDGYNDINIAHYEALAHKTFTKRKVTTVAAAVQDVLFEKYGQSKYKTTNGDKMLSYTIMEPQTDVQLYYATLKERMQVYVDAINARTTVKSQMRFLYDLVREEENIDFQTLKLAIADSNFKGKPYTSRNCEYVVTLNKQKYVTDLSSANDLMKNGFEDPNMYYLLPKRDYDMHQDSGRRGFVNIKRDLLKTDPFYKENRILKVSEFTKTLKSFGKDVTDQKVVYFLLEEDIRLGGNRMSKARETLKDRLNLQDVKMDKYDIYLKVTYIK